jgi:hypothetical protein
VLQTHEEESNMQHPKNSGMTSAPEGAETNDRSVSGSAAALALASDALDAYGRINNRAIADARNADLSDDEIADIIADVGLNAFT